MAPIMTDTLFGVSIKVNNHYTLSHEHVNLLVFVPCTTIFVFPAPLTFPTVMVIFPPIICPTLGAAGGNYCNSQVLNFCALCLLHAGGPTLGSPPSSSYSSPPQTHQPSNPSQTPLPHAYHSSELQPPLQPSPHQPSSDPHTLAMQQLVAMMQH